MYYFVVISDSNIHVWSFIGGRISDLIGTSEGIFKIVLIAGAYFNFILLNPAKSKPSPSLAGLALNWGCCLFVGQLVITFFYPLVVFDQLSQI